MSSENTPSRFMPGFLQQGISLTSIVEHSAEQDDRLVSEVLNELNSIADVVKPHLKPHPLTPSNDFQEYLRVMLLTDKDGFQAINPWSSGEIIYDPTASRLYFFRAQADFSGPLALQGKGKANVCFGFTVSDITQTGLIDKYLMRIAPPDPLPIHDPRVKYIHFGAEYTRFLDNQEVIKENLHLGGHGPSAELPIDFVNMNATLRHTPEHSGHWEDRQILVFKTSKWVPESIPSGYYSPQHQTPESRAAILSALRSYKNLIIKVVDSEPKRLP